MDWKTAEKQEHRRSRNLKFNPKLRGSDVRPSFLETKRRKWVRRFPEETFRRRYETIFSEDYEDKLGIGMELTKSSDNSFGLKSLIEEEFVRIKLNDEKEQNNLYLISRSIYDNLKEQGLLLPKTRYGLELLIDENELTVHEERASITQRQILNEYGLEHGKLTFVYKPTERKIVIDGIDTPQGKKLVAISQLSLPTKKFLEIKDLLEGSEENFDEEDTEYAVVKYKNEDQAFFHLTP